MLLDRFPLFGMTARPQSISLERKRKAIGLGYEFDSMSLLIPRSHRHSTIIHQIPIIHSASFLALVPCICLFRCTCFLPIFFVSIFLVVMSLVKLDSGHVASPTRMHITHALRTLLQIACSGVSSETALWLCSTLLYALREI